MMQKLQSKTPPAKNPRKFNMWTEHMCYMVKCIMVHSTRLFSAIDSPLRQLYVATFRLRAKFALAAHCMSNRLHYSANVLFYIFSRIFILLSQESDQSAITSSLRSNHLSGTLSWETQISAFRNGTRSKLAGLFSTLFL